MGKIYEALEKTRQQQVKVEGTPSPIATPKSVPGVAHLSEELVVMTNPESPEAEAFRFLRSRIVHPVEGRPPRTLLVTSSVAGEGKTLIASNLAAVISRGLDEYVLLVDTDLRAPRVHKVFGVEDHRLGLADYLADGIPVEDLLVKTSVEKLTLMPSGRANRQPTELLSSDRMKSLIHEVRDRYPDRFVIFDSTPLELAPETFVIANEVDAILLVVRCGMTPRYSVRAAMEKIQKEKLLGIVFNGFDKLVKRYRRYGYGSYYGRYAKGKK